MITAILSFAFTLLGFVLIAYATIAFAPFSFILLFIFAVYKAIQWHKAKQKDKLKPNYQNGGLMPKGVPEDQSDQPLSFQTKQ